MGYVCDIGGLVLTRLISENPRKSDLVAQVMDGFREAHAGVIVPESIVASVMDDLVRQGDVLYFSIRGIQYVTAAPDVLKDFTKPGFTSVD